MFLLLNSKYYLCFMGAKKGVPRPSTEERYQKAWLNTIMGRPTQEGIEKKLRSKGIKEIEVKPTFEILKVNDYIHRGEYKKNELYKTARERNEEFLGVSIIKFWYKLLEDIGSQKQISIWEVAEEAGMPRVLQMLADKNVRKLSNFSLIYRFITILGEPFIPIYSQDELANYQIPTDLYKKVVRRKTKRSLSPYEYGRTKQTEAGRRYLISKRNKRNEQAKWIR